MIGYVCAMFLPTIGTLSNSYSLMRFHPKLGYKLPLRKQTSQTPHKHFTVYLYANQALARFMSITKSYTSTPLEFPSIVGRQGNEIPRH